MRALIHVLSLVLLLSIYVMFMMNFCEGVLCIENERLALLSLKHDLVDESNRLGSWSAAAEDKECCEWAGIVCDNVTGHVTHLHLQNPYSYMHDYIYDYQRSALRGKLNPSLLELKRLVFLNLTWNNFGSRIPAFIGSMGSSFTYLDLSNAGFVGPVPPQIGNLTNLRFLSLRGGYDLHVDNLDWVSRFRSLGHLDLTNVDLKLVINWLQVISTNLRSLVELSLSGCQIVYIAPSEMVNFSSPLRNLELLDLSYNILRGPIPSGLQNLSDSLKYLDLSFNSFNSSIPNWLYSSTFSSSLELLHLGFNKLQGNISTAIVNLTSLAYLDLSFNLDLESDLRSMGHLCDLEHLNLQQVNLDQDIEDLLQIHSKCSPHKLKLKFLSLRSTGVYGHLSNHLGKFKKLISLDLGYNSISGSIPISLGSLSSLEFIDISNNLIGGVLSEIHFTNLTKLTEFYASSNSIKLEFGQNWIPPFQVDSLFLASCQSGPQFPQWLRTQSNLTRLDISNSGVSYTIPNWFWSSLSSNPRFTYLNLSNNHIAGEIPHLIKIGSSKVRAFLDFSSNNFEGKLPCFSSNVAALNLSNNSLSGSIDDFLCYEPHVSKRMQVLNLGGNLLSGVIPDCWEQWYNLAAIKLSNNDFSGSIPDSIRHLSRIKSLHLRDNGLSGEIPSPLKNFKFLTTLDLGENQFGGEIPKWIGKNLWRLVVLILRSNKFEGQIPEEFCRLSSLQILDLAHNNLSGHVPRCINNFTAMIRYDNSKDLGFFFSPWPLLEDVLLVLKGNLMKYGTTLRLVRSFDISCNNLSGEIPLEVTSLVQLQSLNLSHNSLTGKIPEDIGTMQSLESLDLSVIQLSAGIPLSISKLTFLSYLNVSSNNLTGMIPMSTQLQSFNASCFADNQLCGPPLSNPCGNTMVVEPGEEDGHYGHQISWLLLSVECGFMVGFWSVVLPLMFY